MMNETRTGDGGAGTGPAGDGSVGTQTASLTTSPTGPVAPPPWWLEHTLWDERMRALDIAMEYVYREAEAAMRKHAPLNSIHEGYGVLAEEFNKEFLDAMHANDTAQAKLEAKQIAAVCLRIMAEIKFR